MKTKRLSLRTITLPVVHAIWVLLLIGFTSLEAQPQPGYWQQSATYEMEINMDVDTYKYKGKQKITYRNNSPDELTRVYFHLYWNAFQPNSMMDVRSRSIADPDRRVQDRISKLNEDNIGYQRVDWLKQGKSFIKEMKVEGTTLEVKLNKPIAPGDSTVFEMAFHAQVPKQIRRSGRNNKEGIALSMTQWYPKLAEYDHQGWHPDPYIGREFHGVWSDFDVKITIHKDYIIGGSGVLQNPQEIGHGYEDRTKTIQILPIDDKLTWHFRAENIHDFAWAADENFLVDKVPLNKQTQMIFVYENDSAVQAAWREMEPLAVEAFRMVGKRFGEYPYPQYTIVQGGDGGMEYGMTTLILGRGGVNNLKSFCGLVVHESLHSWFQHVLATNESLYAWMDEGFTSYAEDWVINQLFEKGEGNPYQRTYDIYKRIAGTEREEALSTHADHFNTNVAYSIGSYIKGSVFLHQLSYIIGEEAFERTMRRYYQEWKFKHPTDEDFIRIAEKESRLVLDWYLQYWVHTTHTIDYGVSWGEADNQKTVIKLERIGLMPMPIDIEVSLKNGEQKVYYIPMVIMRGEKKHEQAGLKREVLPDWPWTNTAYSFTLPYAKSEIISVQIDPSDRMADINKDNNVLKPTAATK